MQSLTALGFVVKWQYNQSEQLNNARLDIGTSADPFWGVLALGAFFVTWCPPC